MEYFGGKSFHFIVSTNHVQQVYLPLICEIPICIRHENSVWNSPASSIKRSKGKCYIFQNKRITGFWLGLWNILMRQLFPSMKERENFENNFRAKWGRQMRFTSKRNEIVLVDFSLANSYYIETAKESFDILGIMGWDGLGVREKLITWRVYVTEWCYCEQLPAHVVK